MPLEKLPIVALLTLLAVAATSPPADAYNWMLNGTPVCDEAYYQRNPAIVSDGVGGAIIAWDDTREGDYYSPDIYAQRIDSLGNLLWPEEGIAICTEVDSQTWPAMISDGSGGAIIVWRDFRIGTSDLYAQRIDSLGNVLWTTNGVPVCTAGNGQYKPTMATDGSGGAIITWYDYRSGEFNIYAQRIDQSGNTLWNYNGVAVCTAPSFQHDPEIISDGSGGAIITWEDQRNEVDLDVYAQLIDGSGTAVWQTEGIEICAKSGDQKNPAMINDCLGGALIVWEDGRNSGDSDIYIQRIDLSGSFIWQQDSVVVCDAQDYQRNPVLISDGSCGAIVAWEDCRNDHYGDIYIQKIDSSGAKKWQADGVVICEASLYQDKVSLISDDKCGAVAVWCDYRSWYYNIFTQLVDASGTVLWPENGVEVCTVPGDQLEPRMICDSTGGAIVVWEDRRVFDNSDIYATRIREGVPPVETELQSWSASFKDTYIEITWKLSSMDIGTSFEVLRRENNNDTAFELLLNSKIETLGLTFTIRDYGCNPSSSYSYRIIVKEDDNTRLLFETGSIEVPAMQAILYQNSPNPFNPITTIRYHLPERVRVRLEIFDASGKTVGVLKDTIESQGEHSVTWNGLDSGGRKVSSGIYFYRLTAGKTIETKKMVLVK